MSPFRFRLQKVLEWRKARLDLEEMNYRRHATILAEVDRQAAEVRASGVTAEREVREWTPVAGLELDALGAFRLRVKGKEGELAATRAEAVKRLAAQQQVMLEARRKLRLLERLKERRRGEWRAAVDKETEETAAESYLARWQPPSAAI